MISDAEIDAAVVAAMNMLSPDRTPDEVAACMQRVGSRIANRARAITTIRQVTAGSALEGLLAEAVRACNVFAIDAADQVALRIRRMSAVSIVEVANATAELENALKHENSFW
jgi:hypothetical protein